MKKKKNYERMKKKIGKKMKMIFTKNLILSSHDYTRLNISMHKYTHIHRHTNTYTDMHTHINTHIYFVFVCYHLPW